MRTNTKEYMAQVKAYFLDCVNLEGRDINLKALESLPEKARDNYKLQIIREIHQKEMDFQIKRIGEINSFKEWLSGLPSCFNIEFENYKILEIAKEWGSLSDHATEAQEDKILENWWNFIANKFFQIVK